MFLSRVIIILISISYEIPLPVMVRRISQDTIRKPSIMRAERGISAWLTEKRHDHDLFRQRGPSCNSNQAVAGQGSAETNKATILFHVQKHRQKNIMQNPDPISRSPCIIAALKQNLKQKSQIWRKMDRKDYIQVSYPRNLCRDKTYAANGGDDNTSSMKDQTREWKGKKRRGR